MRSANESFIHARNLENLLIGSFFGGDLFKSKELGFSMFFMMASLAVEKATVGELAELYSLALVGDNDCLKIITDLSSMDGDEDDKSIETAFNKLTILAIKGDSSWSVS